MKIKASAVILVLGLVAVAGLIGLVFASWTALIIALAVLLASLKIRVLAVPVIIVSSLAWGPLGFVLGQWIGAFFGFPYTSFFLAVGGIMIGLIVNINALEYKPREA